MSLTPDEMARKRELVAVRRQRPLTVAEESELVMLLRLENYRGVALGDR